MARHAVFVDAFYFKFYVKEKTLLKLKNPRSVKKQPSQHVPLATQYSVHEFYPATSSSPRFIASMIEGQTPVFNSMVRPINLKN